MSRRTPDQATLQRHRDACDALNRARAAYRRALAACAGQPIADEHGATPLYRAVLAAGDELQAAEVACREAGEAAYQALKAAGIAA